MAARRPSGFLFCLDERDADTVDPASGQVPWTWEGRESLLMLTVGRGRPEKVKVSSPRDKC